MSVLLISGGIDSIAAWRLLDCPLALYVDHGQPANGSEMDALVWAGTQCERWGFPDAEILCRRIAELHVQGNGYIPYRNALLVMLAANWTGDTDVVLAQVAEWAPDKNPRFYRHLRALMDEMAASKSNAIARTHTVTAPFANVTKGELLALYRESFGRDDLRELLMNTWSCYGSGAFHCGQCSGCVHRFVAERAAACLTTPYRTAPDPESFYRTRANAADAWRWLRSGGFGSAIKRARELRRVLSLVKNDA